MPDGANVQTMSYTVTITKGDKFAKFEVADWPKTLAVVVTTLKRLLPEAHYKSLEPEKYLKGELTVASGEWCVDVRETTPGLQGRLALL